MPKEAAKVDRTADLLACEALEQEYPERNFRVFVRSDVQQYGSAFRDERGDAPYREERE